jgi:16S rRNA (cytidine1402-2'-O)-methyltransferase
MTMPSGKDSSSNDQIPFTGLMVTATPIGNLGDLTPRAESALRVADMIACEDTRHTGKLLTRLGIKTKMIAYHDHSGDHTLKEIITALKDNKTIVLVSDAGTPLISDPGYRLVATCRAEGIAVTALPGASALLTGLSASGLPTDQFYFAGFLPQSMKKKRHQLRQLMSIPTTTVFYENPKRLAATLGMMCDLYPDRDGVVARELTKLHECFYQGTVQSLYDDLKDKDLKGELVLMLGPMVCDASYTDEQVLVSLKDALGEGLSHKDATAHVAALSGRAKKDVYSLALKLKETRNL